MISTRAQFDAIVTSMATGFDSTTLFRRVIEPETGTLAPDLARYLMSLDFKAEDHARFEVLSEKAQDGALSTQEREELEGFLHVDSLLTVMRLKAERSLAIANAG
ncbi:MAG TPA: hypothetical protein VFC78_05910 [Tepidisphaeraceae bacterium]|nr:hypothetical protein [Tepidisphaeraceae bacterium]